LRHDRNIDFPGPEVTQKLLWAICRWYAKRLPVDGETLDEKTKAIVSLVEHGHMRVVDMGNGAALEMVLRDEKGEVIASSVVGSDIWNDSA
jgi:hypothetical protein